MFNTKTLLSKNFEIELKSKASRIRDFRSSNLFHSLFLSLISKNKTEVFSDFVRLNIERNDATGLKVGEDY